MSSEGVMSYEVITRTTNSKTFFDFIRGNLIPCMQPFPALTSIIIIFAIDICSIHHIQVVKDVINQAGIMLLYFTSV